MDSFMVGMAGAPTQHNCATLGGNRAAVPD